MTNRQPRVPGSCPVGFTGRYTIVAGDTLFKIAQRYMINVATLVAANPHITNPDLIYPGDVICVPSAAEIPAGEKITLATTTSAVDTGLLEFLLPRFTAATGYQVEVRSVGSGEALALGEQGKADVLLTHAPEAEKELLNREIITNYQRVMHNDFVIVGPSSDPAKISGTKSATEAFRKIAGSKAPFYSRGDKSGTNQRELEIWSKARIKPSGSWYHKTGKGMAETLLDASAGRGYTLSDRGTYLAMRRNINLQILSEGDPMLLNIYHVMQVNPQKFPNINAEGGRKFVEFMISPETQRIICDFGVTLYGQPLFIPDRIRC